MAEIRYWHCRICAHEQPISAGSVCSGCGNDLLLYGYMVMNGETNGSNPAPAEPAKDRIDPTPTPAEPAKNRVDPTPDPAEPVKNRVDPMPDPAEPVKNRVDPIPDPAGPAKDRIDPTQTPAGPAQDRVDPTQTPAGPVKDRIDPTPTPTVPVKRKGIVAVILITALLVIAAVAATVMFLMTRSDKTGSVQTGAGTQPNNAPTETQPNRPSTGTQPNRPSTGTQPSRPSTGTQPSIPPADKETEQEYERNEYPYSDEPLSISLGSFIGAPTADSILFDVTEDNVIHDGKGSYFCFMYSTAAAAFDNDIETFYDCDEACAFANEGDADFGIIPDDWNCETRDEALEQDLTGYVGAYFEGGIKLTQIRLLPRVNWPTRIYRCYIEVSKDGRNWTKIGSIDEERPALMTFLAIDVPPELENTVYKYVRLVGAPHISDNTDDWSFCNVAEIEIWGRRP